MSEVKFEPLLGDQSVFHKDDKESVVAIGYSLGRSIIKGFSDKYLSTLNQGEQIIAMRRIIKTPVWAVADKEAGRLPEVGCNITNSATGDITVIFSKDDFIVTISPAGVIGKYSIREVFSCFAPIETPAEKAQRFESEWVESAFDAVMIVGVHSTEDIQRIKNHLRTIYRAQLSGELTAPKGGE